MNGGPRALSATFNRMHHIALHLLYSSNQTVTTLFTLKQLHVYLLKAQLHHLHSKFLLHCSKLLINPSYASSFFTQIPTPNSFEFNTIIRILQTSGEPQQALSIFRRMHDENVQFDHFTLPFMARACVELSNLGLGQVVHGQAARLGLDADVFVQTSLIELYMGCECVPEARQVFDEMPKRDVVAWTAIISGYVNKCRDMGVACQLFEEMPDKDVVCWNIVISGFIKIGDMGKASELFCNAPIKDLLMCNTIMAGFVTVGDFEAAYKVFDEMPRRDVVSWNTLISGLVQGGLFNEAISLFRRMMKEGIELNEVTIVSVLSACAQMGALDLGRWVHSYIDRMGFRVSVLIGTALVDMYSKCGALKVARQVFEVLSDKDVALWNAMILGLAMHGKSKEALEFFDQMEGESVRPNEVTVLGALCACSHAGLVTEGQRIFRSMGSTLGLKPRLEHYGCMVDLLGRAGLLNEAYELIKGMPIEPHVGVWGALLGACKIHGNVELAELSFERLLELDQRDGGYSAILSNIYANAGRWGDFARVREMMRERMIYKEPGCSSIEINGEVHEFGVRDKAHLRSKELCKMLEEISRRLKMVGYVAKTSEVFFDVQEEEKELALCYHSEKLAIAYGLIHTDSGATIRIVKNLRVCGDCHTATKLISKIFDREIVVRDRSRFHHFREGSCSCGDYW
ncbi:pentatricopeptide repeat-containing protein At2g29760, chloroplastic-like [Amborella trichopoda]|uniref:pentatricopeptide repeat-containing protein At2g29760, chloroplastic-like n=1 Tax=Amborella trichopoda TaxID=13333 RepID=UPI0009BE03CB|nr:pentatricopeptide repeat-containing protein At2g29760, chloroplastic-like [Amborella trichopoda]|eukprot:XP_011627497.2 pentatricopeptide repeat-containing protein At2g29760, chloroplastic-like [Amborella trichopoda]